MEPLKRLQLRGFKSIKSMDLEFHAMNVLIGANGAGKSNLVSFFKLLNEMMGGRLQQFIGQSGRAPSLLHLGAQVTRELEADLEFQSEKGTNYYSMRLVPAQDSLLFTEERLSFHQPGYPIPASTSLGAGHWESKVREAADQGDSKAKIFRHLLINCRVYHFHDTSPTARVRNFCYVGDNLPLMHDAGNLAAVLLRLQQEGTSRAYQRIVATIRLVAPYFDDFVLRPEGPRNADVRLNWRQRGSDQVFGPHQLSDGTLRAICLVALLQSPEAELPNLIIVDEPELGLHPYALNRLAELFKKTSRHTQVLASTQSSAFLDNFEPEDVIVVDREGAESMFERASEEKLQSWLEEYSLGEVWEKNVMGGGPH
ncbi:MAG TPA: AAA family ATPase [Urbifossiella sp.]|jgi:predicted ATPase|nr:AAA family ATPase [Urbifossiella sp.]